MEELFVHFLLCITGYKLYDKYENTLNRLFLENPTNEILMDLENRNIKDAVLHTQYLMNKYPINVIEFGKHLMENLKPIYRESSMKEFGRDMYELWEKLPDSIGKKDPFYIFSYADDCLAYGDEQQCRELYERALGYYEKM